MDLGSILDARGKISNDMAQLIPTPSVKDSSGDYILPVPFAPLQKELMNPVVNAHYTDIFAFFDADEDAARAQRSLANLQKMKESLNLLAVHPYLLIDHYLPNNLLSREVPHYLAEASGTFAVLGMLARTVSRMGLQVAVVSRAGNTADLLDAFLADKPINFYRYSGTPLRDPRPLRPELSTFHLVPSSLADLTAAVNAAFDFMVLIDESFDTSTPYAAGIRAQLRDPSVRRPLAPIVRLVPLDSITHAAALGRGFSDSLAVAITLKDKAGIVPRDIQPLYDHSLEPLMPWLQAADSPWPLPRPLTLKNYGKGDVEKALMLDTGGSYGAPGLVSLSKGGVVSTESSSQVASKLVPGAESNGDSRAKRLKLDHDFQPYGGSSLTHLILEKYNQLVLAHQTQLEELETLRETASDRQNELERVTAEMSSTVSDNVKLARQAEDAQRRVAKFKADNEHAEERAREISEEWNKTKEDLKSDSVEKKLVEATQRARELEEKLEHSRRRLESLEKDMEFVRSQYQTASSAAGEAQSTLNLVTKERDEFKEQAESKVLELRQLAISEQLKLRDETIAQLQGELDTYKATIKSVMENDRTPSSRDRSRYTNRAPSVPKRGESRAETPA